MCRPWVDIYGKPLLNTPYDVQMQQQTVDHPNVLFHYLIDASLSTRVSENYNHFVGMKLYYSNHDKLSFEILESTCDLENQPTPINVLYFIHLRGNAICC